MYVKKIFRQNIFLFSHLRPPPPIRGDRFLDKRITIELFALNGQSLNSSWLIMSPSDSDEFWVIQISCYPLETTDRQCLLTQNISAFCNTCCIRIVTLWAIF